MYLQCKGPLFASFLEWLVIFVCLGTQFSSFFILPHSLYPSSIKVARCLYAIHNCMSHLQLFMVAEHCLWCIIFHPSHNLAFPARDIIIIINNLPKENSQILKPKMLNLVTTSLGWHDCKLLNYIILLNSLSDLLKCWNKRCTMLYLFFDSPKLRV